MEENFYTRNGSIKITKPIVLIDLDGVLVNFDEKAEKLGWKYGDPKPADMFDDLKPYEGGVEAWLKLQDKFETYIVSTAPWGVPNSWTEKRLWVEKYLGPTAKKKLILTHNKGLIKGDYIIDDRKANGIMDFEGEHIWFRQEPFENWDKVLEYLLK